jgi:hypothetical protein
MKRIYEKATLWREAALLLAQASHFVTTLNIH